MRRKLLVLLLIFSLIPSLRAQNLLKFEWKFRTGDNAAWAWPEYDDSGWDTIMAGTDWENQGFGTYDGFAWYRQEVFIPEDLKKHAEKNGGMLLKLARIDDSDVTYFNGQILGSTGGLPPDYQSGYGDPRVYPLPVDRVNWGAQNTIAVRVYDGGGGGGIIGQPVSLSVKGMDELLVITPMMERQDHLVLHEDPLEIKLLVENKMKNTVEGILQVTAESDFGGQQRGWFTSAAPLPFEQIGPDLFQAAGRRCGWAGGCCCGRCRSGDGDLGLRDLGCRDFRLRNLGRADFGRRNPGC